MNIDAVSSLSSGTLNKKLHGNFLRVKGKSLASVGVTTPTLLADIQHFPVCFSYGQNHLKVVTIKMSELFETQYAYQPTLSEIFEDTQTDFSYSKWDSFRFIDLFAGIGGIRLGFEDVGGRCVFSSEWDEQAAKTYEANFGEKPSGDITKIDASEIPDFDILLGGFPCQPFSIIGDKEGFDHETQGTLFFDIERILMEKMPPSFLLENVRNLTVHDNGNTFRTILRRLQSLGYHVHTKVLNALDFGVPQKRERIIICGFIDNVDFHFPQPVPFYERLSLDDILEDESELDEKLWVRDCIKNSRIERMKKELPRPYITHENVAGSITPHHFSCALRAGASANYILINNERRPSARELLRLQGFPDTFKIVVPYTGIKKQTGNSVAVPVIKAVAREMLKALKLYERRTTNYGK